ncbi:tensin-2-like [Brienomyrus brachyistius]|uniref:tensin-2-like n=1 Tax=Brienomyrus brachyistius TaxID=42636 RepID=UPI0020B459E8|nr:tensin-2-like [Brienomyrus brachyistius]XP_048858363.1 tensin-2-like [Brienomyrus brachyistius]XP_048858364.1 tensin-2-like [Brienomyrus brachyistius]
MGCVLSKWCCRGGTGTVYGGEPAKMGHFDGNEKTRVTKETAPCVPSVCPDQDFFKAVSYTEERSLHTRHSALQVMDRVMERCYNFDLTYITEKIISVFFPPAMEEQQYQANLKEVSAMLKSKHQDNFLIFNLSERRHDIAQLNPKVHDFAWPDRHAPQLDKITAICRAVETWLTSDPQHVVVLYCKGDKGKTGVIVAAYMQYSVSARADHLLSTIAMKKFCEDKLSSFLHPSQNRYVYYFGGLLSGTIKLNSSPLFLHQVLIPNLTNFQAGRGYFPFLKIYESMKLVYTSGVYNPQSSTAQSLCVTMEPALQLEGDIMVKCYHWRSQDGRTDAIFRLQFHTGTIHGSQLWFGKDELDEVCTDNQFPSNAKVEFIFSSGPEKFKEQEYQKNDPKITVEYSAGPLVRWDSYKNFNLQHQDSLEDISHTRGPIDGSLYAQVRKRRGPGFSTVFSVNGSPVARGEQRPSQHLQKVPTGCLQDPPWPPAQMGREEQAFLVGSPEGRNENGTKEKEDKETAILDDTKTAPQECTEAVRVSCWSQSYKKPVCKAPVCLPKVCCLDRCDSSVFRPLPPISPYSKASQSPPTPYQRHNGPSHLSLPWHPHRCHSECSLPHLYPYGLCDAPTSPHAHTLPATSRLLCGVEEHTAYHHHSQGNQLCSHQCHVPNHYLQPFLTGGPVLTRCCSQWDKSAQGFGSIPNKQLSQREVVFWRGEAEIHRGNEPREVSHLEQQGDTNIYWNREAELYQGAGQQQSEETTLPPEEEKDVETQMEREEAFWHQTATASLLLRRPAYPESSCSQSNSRSQSYLDSSSSGYQTPQKLCPSSPYQPSSSESQGYTSGYQSDSTSPLPTYSENSIISNQYTGLPSTLSPRWALPEKHSSPLPLPDRPVYAPGGARYRPGHLTPKDVQVAPSATFLVSRPHSPDHSSCPHAQSPSTEYAHLVISEDNFIPGLASYQSKECKDPEYQTSCIQLQEIRHQIQDLVNHAPEIPESHTSQTALIDPVESLSHRDACTVIAHAKSFVVEESLVEPSVEVKVTSPQQIDIQSGPSSLLCPGTTCTGLGPEKTMSDTGHETDRCTRGPSDLNAMQRLSSASLQTPPQLTSSSKHHASIRGPEISGNLQPILDTDVEDIYHIPRSADGCSTPSFPMATKYYPLSIPVVPYTGYTAVTIPSSRPQLPEDSGAFSPESQHERVSSVRTAMALPSTQPVVCPNLYHTSFSTNEEKLPPSTKSNEGSLTLSGMTQKRVSAKFVQDSSEFWYKPDISRDQAIAALKGMEPGAFLIRDSNSFQGAYGLALKVATLPPNAGSLSGKGDLQEQLVRHFLIEKSLRGVKIRGCPNEPHFGSLSSLVYQHSIMPISLPCVLRIPESDPITDIQDLHAANIVCTAAELLKQGAACSVLYLNSVETESLTGPQAVTKAAGFTLSQDPRPSAIMVHFKVSAQGITLTDRERRLFFRRHYHVNSVTFSSVDPQDRRWTSTDRANAKMFGFVAKKPGGGSENVCHLFAELEDEQPAAAIVNFINKVLLGLHRR